MVESAAVRDISEASVYQGAFSFIFFSFVHQFTFVQSTLSLSSTSKLRTVSRAPFTRTVRPCNAQITDVQRLICTSVVRVRSREGRRNRAPPPRVRWKDGKKVNPAVAAAEDAKAAAARGA